MYILLMTNVKVVYVHDPLVYAHKQNQKRTNSLRPCFHLDQAHNRHPQKDHFPKRMSSVPREMVFCIYIYIFIFIFIHICDGGPVPSCPSAAGGVAAGAGAVCTSSIDCCASGTWWFCCCS